ncbi:uncharacterized protein CIMG_08387 [Coccidioides immitis RS]|uniref:Uncharacterized protein n=1 Tax=Coccidioides immitis (strain RS) TaxID=246410 RepID=J3K5E3_COCIM|nr:uncharacterized protein CIMG_08387 [Coccidioides immitis RS]EAS29641.3 hypothetical protein CIMG_08387 [Coccidioides immitis RS]
MAFCIKECIHSQAEMILSSSYYKIQYLTVTTLASSTSKKQLGNRESLTLLDLQEKNMEKVLHKLSEIRDQIKTLQKQNTMLEEKSIMLEEQNMALEKKTAALQNKQYHETIQYAKEQKLPYVTEYKKLKKHAAKIINAALNIKKDQLQAHFGKGEDLQVTFNEMCK